MFVFRVSCFRVLGFYSVLLRFVACVVCVVLFSVCVPKCLSDAFSVVRFPYSVFRLSCSVHRVFVFRVFVCPRCFVFFVFARDSCVPRVSRVS